MDTQLSEAFYSVYSSSSTIIANKQRHLFCNMLDLLTSTCKTTGLTNNKIATDDMVQFWIGDILPLTLDNDCAIQSSAVAALEQALVSLDITEIHNSSRWSELRSNLITKYASKINELREAKNTNWHKVWCLFIHVLDREILRGASVINSFLSIVELGFRSSDNTVRAEAFICWRLLIKIFSAYEELSAPKRLKLVCIPLKSSQSKSAHTAAVKFRVWWYLLTCLGNRMVQNFDNVVEPFLVFAYGVTERSKGVAQQYGTARELALPALVSMFSMESNELLQRHLRELKLEVLSAPSPLLDTESLKQHWRSMLHAAIEAILILCKHDADDESTETEQHLLHQLIRNLTIVMLRKNIPALTAQFCAELEKLMPSQTRAVLQVFNTIASESFTLQRESLDGTEYKRCLEALLKLCVKAKTHVPPSILQRCISNIFANESLQATNQTAFRVLISILELVMNTNDEEDYDAFEVKLKVWRQITQSIVDYLRSNNLDYRLKQNADQLDLWLLWPLQTCAVFAGRRRNSIFDMDFCELWRQLLNAGQHSIERQKQLHNVKNALHEMLLYHKEIEQFSELFDAYVSAVVKLGITKDAIYNDIFLLLNEILKTEALSQKSIEASLNTLRHMIQGLKNNDLTAIFDGLKPVLSAVVQTWRKRKYEGAFLDEWKRTIQDKLRTLTSKSIANQVKDIFKGNDDFVIIPSVWSLNPEKLTDRQKERFAEKADIPALYNDMSQSQDSSIKPWTPKKIVIAKNKQTEIVIEGSERNNDIILIDESPEFLTTPQKNNGATGDGNKPTPTLRKSHTKAVQKEAEDAPANLDKYSFRKTRSAAEEQTAKTSKMKDTNEDHSKAMVLRHRIVQKEGIDKSETFEKKSPAATSKSPIMQKPASPVKQLPKKVMINNSNKSAAGDETEESFKRTTTNSVDIFAESEGVSATMSIDNNKLPTDEQETELNTMIPTEDIPPNREEPNTSSTPELMQLQETSPKKPTTRFSGLSSPPDRKLTNNSSSPTLRPKPTAHLTGRGAQLINMIRNKSASPYALISNATKTQSTLLRTAERHEMPTTTPTIEIVELSGSENTSTPLHANDLLMFTKRLPSPRASPSVSILKRKMRYESIEESIDSPAFKRKRVSFHDPPVSVTKEYVRDVEENKAKPKRCLVLDKVGTPEIKHMLKRRSRIDSMLEIEKYATEETAKTIGTSSTVANTTTNKSVNELNVTADDTAAAPDEEDSIYTLRWNDSRNTSNGPEFNSTSPQKRSIPVNTMSPTTQERRDLATMDSDHALNVVVEQCSLETVLGRFFAKQNAGTLKCANILSKFLSHQMTTNQKIEANVLETLSETHSKAFLDHAVQENLSSVVCDRLNLNSVLDYICAKSKINTNCRNNLLGQVPDILKSTKADNERMNFINTLLQQSNLNDDNILDLIALLMRLREKRECNVNKSVSESAVDSSSNL